MATPGERSVRFDGFRLDRRSGELLREGRAVRLPPQASKLLLLLTSSPGELVSREEIQKALWTDDTFVDFEHGINKCVAQVRTALGDDAEEPRYVQTVSRRGYRFLGTIEVEASERAEREALPYPGLSTFTERDAPFFFGREGEVQALWSKIERRRLLALIGPSGAGKSSLLRAGLLPSRAEGWRVVMSIPGTSPISALTRAMLSETSGATERSAHTLVVVDAFEEVFTLNPPEVQKEFAGMVGRLATEPDVHVLLSMRDDFLFRCHEYESLSPVFFDLTPIGPPKGEALRGALVSPALSCGYGFESGELVDEMLSEVENERGALPLLAFAAARLWERRDRERKLLTRRAYEDIGRVGGALAQHADQTLARIGASRQGLARELFRNLITAQGTRASREVSELLSVFPKEEERREAEGVLRELVTARLLTSYETSVEIIHESLLNTWPRVVQWRNQDEGGALLRDQLRQAAQAWLDRGRPDDLLWTGSSYREFSLWRERYAGGLTKTEEEFARAATRLAGRRRRRRRMAVASMFVAMLAVMAVVLISRQQAVDAALRAEASKLLALGQVDLDSFPTAALAYATKSLELADTDAGRLFALRVLQRAPIATFTPLAPHDDSGEEAFVPAFSPNGDWLALGGWKRATVFHRSGPSRTVLGDFREANDFMEVAFGPESDILAAVHGGDVRVFSIPEGRELRRGQFEKGSTIIAPTENGFITWASAGRDVVLRIWPFDPGESRVIGSTDMEDLSITDVARGRLAYSRGRKIFLRSLEDWASPPRLLAEHEADIMSVAFTPDAQRLAASDRSGEIRIWSTVAPTIHPLRVLRGRVTRWLRFDPRGRRLAGTVGGLESEVWDLDAPPSAVPIVLERTDMPYLLRPTFDPSGEWLVTTHTADAAFWGMDESLPRVLSGLPSGKIHVAFTPDGKFLVSASTDEVRVWPLSAEGGAEGRPLTQANVRLQSVTVDSASRNAIVPDQSGNVLFIPLAGGSSRKLEACESACAAVAIGDQGRLVAAAPAMLGPPEDRWVIRIFDLETGVQKTLQPAPGMLEGAGWSFVGLEFLGTDRLLASQGDKGLFLFDLRDGSSRLLAPQPRGRFALARKERFVVGLTGWAEGVLNESLDLVRIDLEGGLPWTPHTLGSHGNQVSAVALDPTEWLVATGSLDGTVRVGPASGGEPHVFLGHRGQIWSVAFSPDGRWLASAGDDRQILLWPVPDVSQPPLHTLPHPDLLRDLRSRTNLRVVPDSSSPTGWRLDRDPFPGWGKRLES
jgi:WD40 repeat protein/DNA-binding winged helix-turn-helix (wHTH) protein/energy-coupling factor transporter ATP-binding protein EcfA2